MCLKKLCLQWGICSLDDYKVPVAFFLFLISFPSIKEDRWSHHWAPILVFLLPAAFPDGPAHRDAAGHWGDTSCCTWEPSCIAPSNCVFGEGWAASVKYNNTSWLLDYCQEESLHCASESFALSKESLWLICGFSELAIVRNYLGLHFFK